MTNCCYKLESSFQAWTGFLKEQKKFSTIFEVDQWFKFYIHPSPLYVLSVMSVGFRYTSAPVWSVVSMYLCSASGFCGVGLFLLFDVSLLYACLFCTCLFCDGCVPPLYIRISVVLVWYVFARRCIFTYWYLFSASGLSGVSVSPPLYLPFLGRQCVFALGFVLWSQFYGGVISVFALS